MKPNYQYLQDLLTNAVRQGVFPGAATAVGSAATVRHFAVGSTAPLSESSTVDTDTLYDVASLTKPFTAMAAMILLERGFWRLDDPVCLFAPEFDVDDKLEITIRHLLTHSSGLSAHEPLYLVCHSTPEMLATIAATPLKHGVGERVVYSCLGFIVLGHLISQAYGAPLSDVLHREIFDPLGMYNTFFPGIAPVVDRQRIAPTEYCRWRSKLMWGEVHDENAYAQAGISGNAGLFSTAGDMAIFASMLLNRGLLNGRAILSPASIEMMEADHTTGLNESRGLGWQKKTSRLSWFGDLAANTSYGHTGFTGTSLWISPDQDFFTVILSNRVYPTRYNNQHIRFRALFNNAALAARLDS
ncbi:MAG TPA: serine hydrolase domain-containing protein [Bacillota bacterium]|nr:serine hydrolase domain-containing protein [Bacillota bacterium]